MFLNIVLLSAAQHAHTPLTNNLLGSLLGTGANYFGMLFTSPVILLLYCRLLKNQKRLKPGTAYPVFLMLYCGIRFFTEFLRSSENILWIFKTHHFLCLAGFILGAAAYRIILRSSEKTRDRLLEFANI